MAASRGWMRRAIAPGLIAWCLFVTPSVRADASAGRLADAGAEQRLSLFNGKDPTGWTAKITVYPLGENHADTFRVELLDLEGCLDPAATSYRSWFVKSRPGDCAYER